MMTFDEAMDFYSQHKTLALCKILTSSEKGKPRELACVLHYEFCHNTEVTLLVNRMKFELQSNDLDYASLYWAGRGLLERRNLDRKRWPDN
jgi:hypothetical protein